MFLFKPLLRKVSRNLNLNIELIFKILFFTNFSIRKFNESYNNIKDQIRSY